MLGSMGKHALSWFLRLLESHLRLIPVKWQVICNLFVVLLIESFQDGSIAATHHQAMSSIRRLHHIRGFVHFVAENNSDPAFE
jgi:hypothetical protein